MMPFPVFMSSPGATAGTVVLQVQPAGADGSTTFTDQSTFARSLTTLGNAQVDTGVLGPFGTPTSLHDGNGDYIEAANSADFDFGNGDWTIEIWVKFATTAPLRIGLVSKMTGGNSFNFGIAFGAATFTFYDLSNTSYGVPLSGTVLNTTDWHHFAAARSGGTVRVYQNGNLLGSRTVTSAISIQNLGALRIGDLSNFSSYCLNGNIAGVRITKGAALYDGATYTVPTAAFPIP